MKRIAAALLWTSLFLVLLAGVDQFFLRVPTTVPVLAEVRAFYLDFRGRLAHLGGWKQEPTLESVIDQTAAVPPGRSPRSAETTPRFLYADRRGELHFADTMEEIPPEYRKEAQPLEPN
jgi:hypothetical protein